MPKLKTNRAAAKRMRFTASGKVKRDGVGSSHLLAGKSAKRRRKMRKGGLVHEGDMDNVRNLLPYA